MYKKKGILAVAAMAAMMMTGCSKDMIEEAGSSAQSQAIGFDGYLGRSANVSRGSVNDVAAIQESGFGVYGQYSENGASTISSFVPDLFKNVQVSTSDWTYSPLRYWPTEGSIDFVAYAPYHSDAQLNGTKLAHTVAATTTEHVDLLWAKALGQTKASNSGTNKVNFQFSHALSKIGYSVKTTSNYENYEIKVQKITLAGSADGKTKAFYTAGNFDLNAGTWSDQDGSQNFAWFDDAVVINSVAQNNANDNFLFVIPQNFDNSTQLYVIVEYTVKGADGVVLKNKVTKQLVKEFAQSKAYMINLSIGLTPIEFTASVANWVDAEGVDASWN